MAKTSITNISSDPHWKNYIILGGGPVGCYLAYSLLKQENSRVFIFEGRKFERPQVIRIPFCIAENLPEQIQNSMWFDEETRAGIFNSSHADDQNFWPKPGYPWWSWINIGFFQEKLINFLETVEEYQNRFFFIPITFDLGKTNYESEIKKLFPIENAFILDNITAIYCTCGTYSSLLRTQLDILDGKPPEEKSHGIYLIYQNQTREDYQREGQFISYSKLGENGISYAASNNYNLDVQLYTYPAGQLSSVFNTIPESFIQRAKYSSLHGPINLSGNNLPVDAREWLERYKNNISQEISKYDIKFPDDLAKIDIFYASRSEYYWNKVTAKVKWQNRCELPIFFIGDSAGSTDYKFGLSVGRGLFSVDMLTGSINSNNCDFDVIATNYQSYWDKIISREFNKGASLSIEPWIQYQYLVKGRKVNFNNRQIHFNTDEQYEIYLDEYQYLSTDFRNTSESNSILFINTKAIKQNIKNIISFGAQCSNSKIIGVVKSNAYGLGSNLVANLAIEEHIDFLAVAKLQEAVALRKAGIPNNIRLMCFETPLVHDLSTYAANRIEVILPSNQNADSIKIISHWLEHKRRISEKLKVHIMVDTGMRRDGGYANNLPDSVMKTILALQLLDPDQVEFSGISTHLSCYRCTDYKGEEIINFRSLQFCRLEEVVLFLLSKNIRIPLIHIGGGLALLAEKWPLQFKKIAYEHDVELYTRVGHGLYGMELQQDLHLDSPKLNPVVKMDFEVRNVFYIEAGEPVSYGGYWRAPKGGTWIATLAGGWAEGVPRTARTLGEWEDGMMISINNKRYPVVGKINMNAMMVNLGSTTEIRPGDRAIIFGWRSHEPKLNDLAQLSGQIGPSIIVNVPSAMPRIQVSE